MTALTPTQWHVLTYIQGHERQYYGWPRVNDIKAGCGFDSRRDLHCVLLSLEELGLVKREMKVRNGMKVRYARTLKATGMVGVEVPVLEVEREHKEIHSVEA